MYYLVTFNDLEVHGESPLRSNHFIDNLFHLLWIALAVHVKVGLDQRHRVREGQCHRGIGVGLFVKKKKRPQNLIT